MKIIKAELKHSEEILELTKRAFLLYKSELKAGVAVKALDEKIEQVENDIVNQLVYVAISHGKIIGSIRVEKLNDELAYIYRFSVEPEHNGTGIGSAILAHAIEECEELGVKAITLHTNTKYFKLARYYYGKDFFVHSTTDDRGYIRALFVKELTNEEYDINPAFCK